MNAIRGCLPKSWRRNLGAFYRRVFRPDETLPADVDEETLATWAAVKPYTMTSMERIIAVCDAVRYITRYGVTGAVVECGVWRGGSVLAALRTLMSAGDSSRDVYLFDTFEGMPEPGLQDRSTGGRSASDLLKEEAKDANSVLWAYAPLEGVKVAVAQAGYPAGKLHFVRGRVEDTLPDHAPEKIALLRLDTDWYASTKAELQHLFPRLQAGGVIIIDDYGHWEGAQRAVDEYFAEQGIRIFLQRIDYTCRAAVKQ